MMDKIPDVWVGLIRQVLVGVGTPLLARYGIDAATTGSLADLGLAAFGGFLAFGSAAWMIYTKAGTRAVPLVTAAREDVPTINPITGQKIPGAQG